MPSRPSRTGEDLGLDDEIGWWISSFSCSLLASIDRLAMRQQSLLQIAILMACFAGKSNAFLVADGACTPSTFRMRKACRRPSFLRLSAIADSEPSSDARSSIADEMHAIAAPPKPERSYELPWTDVQAWTLRDQLPRYTIQVQVEDPLTKKTSMRVCTLWRTLEQEVTELSGYPLTFLMARHAEMMEASNSTWSLRTPTEILPCLDNFEFSNSGGLAGQVYGVGGVADGTWIETTPVGSVSATVPRGFVQTLDGSLFELGRPATETELYSLNGRIRTASTTGRVARSIAKSLATASDEPLLDPDILNLGALTAVVIGGALALESLSHHLTVNVFWV